MEAPSKPRYEIHDQISEWLAQMRKAAAFLYGEATSAEIAALANFYQREVRPHFAYEEQRLFPALRRLDPAPELHQALAEFEREHVVLIEKLDPLIEDLRAIAKGLLSGPQLVDISRRARLVIDLLLLHAAQEDDVMLPLFERYGTDMQRELAKGDAI